LNIFSHNIEVVGIRICYGTEQSPGSGTIANMFHMDEHDFTSVGFFKTCLANASYCRYLSADVAVSKNTEEMIFNLYSEDHLS
jgi:predicted metal-binding protein